MAPKSKGPPKLLKIPEIGKMLPWATAIIPSAMADSSTRIDMKNTTLSVSNHCANPTTKDGASKTTVSINIPSKFFWKSLKLSLKRVVTV